MFGQVTQLYLKCMGTFHIQGKGFLQGKEGSECSWCCEQPSHCICVRGYRTRWQLSSQCSCRFPEHQASTGESRIVELGKWRAKEGPEVGENKVRERMIGVTAALLGPIFLCFLFLSPKGEGKNPNHLLILFIYPFLSPQILTFKDLNLD